MDTTFISGKELSNQFYLHAVRPILADHFPGLKHAAALIGEGSEVLGFDDEVSTDHHWGPRVTLFLEEENPGLAKQIHQVLAENLPYEFMGYPTNFTQPDPHDQGVQLLQQATSGPVNHRVTTHSVQGFFLLYLGFDIHQALKPADWLTFPEHKLRSIVDGTILHDDVGLGEACTMFQYYPLDVWLYLLAAGWARISQEEHLMGRAGMVGDEVGSALIGARLVRDVMRLCFLMAKTYAPYAKWFGTAFKQLVCGEEIWPVLLDAVHARTWQEREEHLVKAYEYIANWHNGLIITDILPEKTVPFHKRPFQVIAIHGFTKALLGQIEDPDLRRLSHLPPIGGIDQISDNTDFVSNPIWRQELRELYM
jgi:hypothetical protein